MKPPQKDFQGNMLTLQYLCHIKQQHFSILSEMVEIRKEISGGLGDW